MKKIFTIILFLGISMLAIAQQNYQDVVYLKNGSIIRGIIIEQIPNTSIKIETADKSVFVYQMSDIEKFTKEPYYKPDERIPEDNTGVKKGYYGAIEFGPGYTFNYLNGILTGRLNIINGYRINPHFAVGGGFGLRAYTENGLMFPFFVDLRTNFLNKKTSPFLSLGIGYAFFAKDDMKGGLLINPIFGVSTKIKNRSSIYVGFSYEAQGLKHYDYYYDYNYYYYYNYPGTRKEVIDYSHTISFQLGFSF